ncbi:MAG: flippase-like domain-containing protein [Muribaculaceae bacterium]|nr:flippase-like domain-containing protein [Muribaculaceae bacterium]
MTDGQKDKSNEVPSKGSGPQKSFRKWFQRLEQNKTFILVKKIAGYVFRYGFPLAVSLCLILWLFHKVNFHQVMEIAHRGCNYWFIGIMMAVTTLSLMVRGVRWGLQLVASGVKPMSMVAEWVCLFGAYALNLVFPQMGEAWRCLFVSKRQKAPLSTVVGTDIGDRFIDWVIIMILFIVALIVAHPYIMEFMNHYEIGREVKKVVDNATLWISLGGSIAFLVALLYFFRRKKWAQSISNTIKKMWLGFSVIFRMKLWWLYLLLSILTWVLYFIEIYICFFSFSYTKELVYTHGLAYGLLPGLVAFVFGSLSMGIPSNGGLGPWNLAIMFALSLFGISNTDGTAFSIVVWSFQSLMYVALGIFALAYIMVTGRKLKKEGNPESDPGQTPGQSGVINH